MPGNTGFQKEGIPFFKTLQPLPLVAQGLAGDYEALGVQEDGTVFQKSRVRKQPDKYLPIEEQSDLTD